MLLSMQEFPQFLQKIRVIVWIEIYPDLFVSLLVGLPGCAQGYILLQDITA